MTNIEIQTLTPVHIGSGRDLMHNTEFLLDNGKIGVVDEKKVLKIIGEENIDKWVNIINSGESLLDYVKLRKSDIELNDISNRTMSVYGSNLANKQSLKEQLHSAKLLPMIPGSSIKGAIRTAVISWLVNNNTSKVSSIINKQKGFFISKRHDWQWNLKDFQKVEANILNELLSGSFRMDANKNTLRFLHISDFVFNYGTLASNMQVMNYYGNKWEAKRGSDQLVEMIGSNSIAEGRIKINKELLNINITNKEIQSDINFLSSTNQLFNIIKNHTKKLVDKEVKLWEEDDASKSDNINDYIEKLILIRDEINNCNENEAILRVGGGSGWDFITGAWAKTNTKLFNNDEYDKLMLLLNKGRDVEYFPKTRKMDEDGDLMGFVKLSIL